MVHNLEVNEQNEWMKIQECAQSCMNNKSNVTLCILNDLYYY